MNQIWLRPRVVFRTVDEYAVVCVRSVCNVRNFHFPPQLVACPNHLKPSLAGGDQPVRADRPFERLRLLLVVQRDELLNRRLEILEGIVDAAPETAAGQLPEEALDRVRPEAGGRRKVEEPAGMVLHTKALRIE